MRERVLLAAHPTMGHTHALRTIARSLRARGAEVRFVLPAAAPPRWLRRLLPDVLATAFALGDAIEREGTPVLRVRPPALAMRHAVMIPWRRGYDELETALRFFTSGLLAQARAIEAHARDFAPDVVVGDFTLHAAWLASERIGAPFVAFFHSGLPFPIAGGAPFGSGLRDDAPRDARWRDAERRLAGLVELVDREVARARRSLALPVAAPGLLMRPFGERSLIASHPALERPMPDLGPTVEWIGPCLAGRGARDEGFPWDALDRSARRVYVSMGTVFHRRPEVFAAILRAIDRPGVQILVSAGGSYDALARARWSDRVRLFRRVPQVALLPEVDLVIGHGGNNTVQETLAAGRPLVVIPVGAEQISNALRVEALGAGVAVLEGAREDAVRAAFERVAADPKMTARAREISDALGDVDGTAAATDAILTVAQTRARGQVRAAS